MSHFPFKTALLTCWLFAGGFFCPGQTPDTGAQTAVNAPSAPAYIPLTQPERFHRYLKGLFSAEAVARSLAGAGLQQWSNTPSEWGQGIDGYARRFGNSYGEHLVRQTIAFGLSSALNEDNRYFRSERTGFGPRTMYAVESTFLARRSDGTRRLSYSRLGAVVATAFISRT